MNHHKLVIVFFLCSIFLCQIDSNIAGEKETLSQDFYNVNLRSDDQQEQIGSSRMLQNNLNSNQVASSQPNNAATLVLDDKSEKTLNSAANQSTAAVVEEIPIHEIDNPILGKGFKADNGYSFQKIRVNKLEKKFLFFYLIIAEKDQWQNIIVNVNQQGRNTSLATCKKSLIDSCYVEQSQLASDSIIFVTVQCQEDCTYNLKAHWSDLQHFRPGDDIIFMFGKQTNQLYHLELEDQDQFTQIRVHLRPRVTRRPFDNVKIYGNFGNQNTPTPQAYDFQSINLWEDGEGLFFTKAVLQKHTSVTLLIVGQAQTTYQLTCQKITKSIHEVTIGESIYEYLEKGSSKKYQVKFDGNGSHEEYSLKFSTLAGDLTIGYYLDQEKKVKYSIEPFEYMRDSEHVFFKSAMVELFKSGLYIFVDSKDRDATYTISFTARYRNDSIQLHENVYSFIPITADKKIAYFNFEQWIDETQAKSNLKFTVYTIAVAGATTPLFRICKTNLIQCTNSLTYKENTEPLDPTSTSDNGLRTKYDFEIEAIRLSKINVVEEQGVVVIELFKQTASSATQQQSNVSLIALEFLNNNKVLYLREGRAIEDKLAIAQTKYYKYINSDPKVKEIRVHVNEMVGHVTLSGIIKDVGETPVTVIPDGNVLRFTKNLTKTIMVGVQAKSAASIYGISMQILHQSDGKQFFNLVTMSQDIYYTSIVQPNTYTIFQIMPVYNDFYFKFNSTSTVITCLIDPLTNTCNLAAKNNSDKVKMATSGEIVILGTNQRKQKVKISNPFGDSSAQVTTIFHSYKYHQCEIRKIGQVYNQIAKNGTCLRYILQGNNQDALQLYISKRQFGKMSYSILICDMPLKVGTEKLLKVTPEQMDNLCKNQKVSRDMRIMWTVHQSLNDQEETALKVDIVAQFEGNFIMLPEGVSYSLRTNSKDTVLKTFAFNLFNRKDTRIILNPVKGKFVVYAKIVHQATKELAKISKVDYQFTSTTNQNFEQNPIIYIHEEDISAINCINCALVIAVFSLDTRGIEVEFDLEVVQRFISLDDHKISSGFLEQLSSAYYSYHTRRTDQTTLVVLLSDHNELCANILLGLTENPSEASYIARTEANNQLIYKHPGGETTYFIAVQAIKKCDYTISVKTIDTSITELARGRQNLIRLNRGQIKYFSFMNYENEPFKILSVSKYGDLKFYLNKTDDEPEQRLFSQTDLDKDKFSYESEERNSLSISKEDKIFCKQCNYFLGVEALKNSQSTLYLVYPETIVPLIQNRIFSDYLQNQNDFTLASYNRIQQTSIEINLISGELVIIVMYKEQKIQQKFIKSPNLQKMILNISADAAKTLDIRKTPNQANFNVVPPILPYIEKIPVNLMFQANAKNTEYSLQFKSQVAEGSMSANIASYQTLRTGEHNKINLIAGSVSCLVGYYRDVDDELFISTSEDNVDKLKTLIMQIKIDEKVISTSPEINKNIITLPFAKERSTKVNMIDKKFELCLKYKGKAEKTIQPDTETNKPQQNQTKSKEIEQQFQGQETLAVLVHQSNNINALAANFETRVKSNQTFMIYSDGDFLLDVFSCSGKPKLLYASSLQGLDKVKMKNLETVGISASQKHAVKVSLSETTFLKIETTDALIKWIPIDFEKETGIGYFIYEVGDLKYTSRFKNIDIVFDSLKKLKNSKIKINSLSYSLYISADAQELQEATECDYSNSNVTVISMNSPGEIKNIFSLDKEIFARYESSENIFINIVASLIIQTPFQSTSPSEFDQHEHYKFIYNRQQIPRDSFTRTQIQEISYLSLGLLIAGVALLFILATYLFTRKIVPMIARLKQSNLVEEQDIVDAAKKEDGMEVPQSSDRNRIQPQVVVETEEKMDNKAEVK